MNEVTAVGVHFNNYDNLCNKLEKANSRAKFWGIRDLSIYGRITLIKYLLILWRSLSISQHPYRDQARKLLILSPNSCSIFSGGIVIKSNEIVLYRSLSKADSVCSTLANFCPV